LQTQNVSILRLQIELLWCKHVMSRLNTIGLARTHHKAPHAAAGCPAFFSAWARQPFRPLRELNKRPL